MAAAGYVACHATFVANRRSRSRPVLYSSFASWKRGGLIGSLGTATGIPGIIYRWLVCTNTSRILSSRAKVAVSEASVRGLESAHLHRFYKIVFTRMPAVDIVPMCLVYLHGSSRSVRRIEPAKSGGAFWSTLATVVTLLKQPNSAAMRQVLNASEVTTFLNGVRCELQFFLHIRKW